VTNELAGTKKVTSISVVITAAAERCEVIFPQICICVIEFTLYESLILNAVT
jgi:hypothetical protein